MKQEISTTIAAEICGVTTETIRNLCKAGVLPCKKRGKMFRITSMEAIEKYRDDAKEIDVMTTNIEELKKELKEKKQDLEERIASVKVDLYEAGFAVERVRKTNEIAMNIIAQYADGEVLTKRESDLLKRFLATGFYTLSLEEEPVTQTRMNQIWNKSMYRLEHASMAWSSLRAAYKDCREKLEVAKEKIVSLKAFIKEHHFDEDCSGAQNDPKWISDMAINLMEQPLSTRTHNCLAYNKIETLGDLMNIKDPHSLLRMRNFGFKSMQELQAFAESKGYKLFKRW